MKAWKLHLDCDGDNIKIDGSIPVSAVTTATDAAGDVAETMGELGAQVFDRVVASRGAADLTGFGIPGALGAFDALELPIPFIRRGHVPGTACTSCRPRVATPAAPSPNLRKVQAAQVASNAAAQLHEAATRLRAAGFITAAEDAERLRDSASKLAAEVRADILAANDALGVHVA